MSQQIIAPAVALTLWHAGGLRPALSGARELLAQAQPDVVQIHAGPTMLAQDARYVATAVRLIVPRARIWIGVGCDGWLRGYHAGEHGRPRAIEKILSAADLASSMDAEAVVWNAESFWKTHPDDSAEIAAEIVRVCAIRYPGLAQGHTAYDHPTYHSTYPWRAWLGPDSPVSFALPQVYAAPGGGDHVQAHRGALAKREAASLRSWQVAVRKGWIRPDVTPDTADDLDWYPYVQAHSVPAVDTVRLAMAHPVVAFWAAPSRIDAEGRLAVLTTCALRRLGHHGVDGIKEFQRAHSLKDDGVAGPLTRAALGVS